MALLVKPRQKGVEYDVDERDGVLYIHANDTHENFRLANTSIPFESFFEGWAASLEMNGKLGDFNVTAITGFRKSNDQLLEENTGTPPASYTGVPGAGVPLFVAARDQDYKQFSQEIRVAGDITDWMDIVLGGYYFDSTYTLRQTSFFGFLGPGASAFQLSIGDHAAGLDDAASSGE